MKTVTYSPSVTRTLSRFCPNRCLYCGFHRGEPDPASPRDIARSLGPDDGPEVLLMAGERPERDPAFLRRLRESGFESLARLAAETCRRILELGLLPHVNIGMLGAGELSLLRPHCASVGLMLESVDPGLGSRVHPGKDIAGRVRTMEAAGELRMPLTTGILVGIGETQESRTSSLETILGLHRRHGHVQEIIIQPFVPNPRSRLKGGGPVLPRDLAALVRLIAGSAERSGVPAPAVQVPPNLLDWRAPAWKDLLEAGVSDLGGISPEPDRINPENPWPPLAEIADRLLALGRRLERRLPVHPRFISPEWLSREVLAVIERRRSPAGTP